jgi:Alr-MurF fusion protein
MISCDFNRISSLLKTPIQGDAISSSLIREISYDSRKVVNPGHCLFVAIKTNRNDGHKFIPDLIRLGVKHFLVQEIYPVWNLSDASFILVENTLTALQKLAQHHRAELNIPVIGITGSNGKTIVKEWLFQCLNSLYNVARSPRSYNSQIGVALSILPIEKQQNLAIIEAGISLPGEMDALQQMIQPNIGIFTNMRSAHAENFASAAQHIQEKMKLFAQVETLVCSSAYPEIIREAKNQNIPLFTWGFNAGDNLKILSKTSSAGKTILTLSTPFTEFDIQVPFSDEASIENALHVVALQLLLKVDIAFIQKGLQALQAIEMRLEIRKGIRQCTIINDTWSADLDSLRIAMEAMEQQPHDKRTLIISDVFESGQNEVDLYKTLAELCRQKKIQRIIGVGEKISQYASFFEGEKSFYLSTEALLERLPAIEFRQECILLKGSRIFEFERIAAQLQEMSHETVLEINLSALLSNLNTYRSLIGPNVKTMAMVKAFAYGSGSIEIANLLQFHGVDYLAVAYADEGIALRRAGISLPILVLSPELESFSSMIEYGLEPEIYSFRILDAFINAVVSRGGFDGKPARIQIKLDTGMHRLGFEEQDIDALIERLKATEMIEVVGIFSHLVASGEPEHDAFTRHQIERFEKWSTKIQASLNLSAFRHLLNSSGIRRFPEARYDLVRLGIGLYGIAEDVEQNFLSDVSALKTTISQIRKVSTGESVGYSRKAILNRTSRIATLPIGYADGFLRKLGNGKSNVMIHGKPAPTVGNICMDMCMVDVTDIPEAQEGDIAVIFATAADIKRISNQLETIPYEVLTSISERVKRVYIQE